MGNKFYSISTAIDYPSAPPHLGHMYEKVCADAIARFKRLEGKNVHFSTGLDCHGSKIARYAREAGKTPEEFVACMEGFFLELCKNYNISYDDFIKTIEKRHEDVVAKMIVALNKKGDIYKGKYSGYYCSDCETYFSKEELENGINCPTHKRPTEFLEEDAYFFKMGKYQNKIADYIKNNPNFIRPEKKKNEILARLSEPLHDLCLTRQKITWGLPFPLDNKLVTAIWIDALINYLTTLEYPNKKFKEYWPMLHIIGSDIIWHHSVIWGTWLLASGVKLPNVYVHGFIRSSTGEKMSKSLGNVIDPLEIIKKYPADSIRYFLIREIPFGDDGDFSENALVNRHNNELANDLGNLVSRVLTLAEKNFESVKKTAIDKELKSKLNIAKINDCMNRYELHNALSEIWKFVNEANRYVNEKRPWELKNKKLEKCIYNLLESIRIISILTWPFMPGTSDRISRQLNVKLGSLKECKFGVIKEYRVEKGEILFKKIN